MVMRFITINQFSGMLSRVILDQAISSAAQTSLAQNQTSLCSSVAVRMSSSENWNGLAKVFKSMLHLPSYSRWQQLGTHHTLSALVADLK